MNASPKDYPFDKSFQSKVLACLVQEPEKFLRLVEPRYFTVPSLIDIARLVKDTYARHGTGKFRLGCPGLCELAKELLGPKRPELWPHYKQVIRRAFRSEVEDEPLVLEKSWEFARTRQYEEALISAEKAVHAGKFEDVHRKFDELRSMSAGGQGLPLSIAELKRALRRQMKRPPQEVEWDMLGFFPANSIILVAGRRADGKSYFFQAFSKACTLGSELVPGLPVRKKPMLYCVREGTQALYDQRFGELEFNFRAKANRSFVLWGPWMQPPPPMIGEAMYRQWAKEFAPCNICLDGLRRFFVGDENSSEVIDPIGQELTQWTVSGATVHVAHHRGKSGSTESRGSSGIEDLCGVQYVLEAHRQGRRITEIQLRCLKNWFGDEKILALAPHWENGKFWFSGGEDTRAEEQWARDKEKVLRFIPVDSFVPRKEIVKKFEDVLNEDRILEILQSEVGRLLHSRRGSQHGGPIEYRRLGKSELPEEED
jgi:hypothetical protein